MKLFFYYVTHTFKNQLRKLFKTWIMAFLAVCVAVGILSGLVAGLFLGDGETAPEGGGQTGAIVETPAEGEMPGENLPGENLPGEDPDRGLTPERKNLIELIAGGVMLAILLFMAAGADKNGSQIFLPADVNLLFPSPMRPQSVLLFRLTTRLGALVLGSLYLLLEIPSLRLAGLGTGAALAFVPAWCLTLVLATLIQMLFYMLAATRPAFKRWLRKGIYALILLIALGYFLVLKQHGGYLSSAYLFFNGRFSRWIPVWGWLKGFLLYTVEGNGAAALLMLALTLLACAGLICLIRCMKADFYEDAMAKSEETAALMEAARSDGTGGASRRRKKDRSEKLQRDGLRHGCGANIFFFKTLYNRFRFARFGFLTGTMGLYFVAAVGQGLIFRSLLPVVLTAALIAFLRSLGNPLAKDTDSVYFLMTPESGAAKLFWSLAGGTVNCFLDVLLPVLLGAVLAGSSPFAALLWIPLIVSADFYATSVGAFIHLSVPVSAGAVLKKTVQVMFVYFGLLPDLAVLWLLPGIGAPVAALINFGIGFLFLGLSSRFLCRR